jgi:putative hydrolase of the HAD superfamily
MSPESPTLIGARPMMANLTVLVDGDDTLWRSQEYYDEAKAQFVCMLKEQGLSDIGKGTIARLDRIDSRRVAARGLTIQRFIESMFILYNCLCEEQELPYSARIEKEIAGLSSIVSRPPVVYDDVPEALEKLSKKFRLILFTAGHPPTQKSKISSLNINLDGYFEDMRFVCFKSAQRLSDELSLMKMLPSEVWSIGNSLRSDVLPAITVGANAILVERGGWLYDTTLPDMKNFSLKYSRVDSLLKAADLILSI